MSKKEGAMKQEMTAGDLTGYRTLLGEVIPAIRSGQIKLVAAAEDEQNLRFLVTTTDKRTNPVATCVGKLGAHATAIGARTKKDRVDFYAHNDDPLKLFTGLLWPGRVSDRATKHDFAVVSVVPENNKTVVVVQATASDFKKITAADSIALVSKLVSHPVEVRRLTVSAAPRASTPIVPPADEALGNTPAPEPPKAPAPASPFSPPPVVTLGSPEPIPAPSPRKLAIVPTAQPTPPPTNVPATEVPRTEAVPSPESNHTMVFGELTPTPAAHAFNPADRNSVPTENPSVQVSLGLVREAVQAQELPPQPAAPSVPSDAAAFGELIAKGQEAEAEQLQGEVPPRPAETPAAGPEVNFKPFGGAVIDSTEVPVAAAPKPMEPAVRQRLAAAARQKAAATDAKAKEQPVPFSLVAGGGISTIIIVLYYRLGGS